MSAMSALIAGGAGFIGTNLALNLIKRGKKVHILDNMSTGRIKNLRMLQDLGSSVTMGDICDAIEITGDFSEVYNLACPASPPKYQIDPIQTLKTNFIGTKNLLDFAVKKNCKFLLASTSEIYGDPLVSPQTEEYRGNCNTIGPRSCYDEGKRVAETLTYEYKKQFNLDAKIIRIFNTYGPFMDPDDGRVVTNFIKQALTQLPITIYGTGRQTRSFQYIDDLVKGINQVMESGNLGPYNVGNENEFEIKDLLSTLERVLNEKFETQAVELPVDDPLQRKPNISRMKSEFEWAPKIELEEGLIKTIEYIKGELF